MAGVSVRGGRCRRVDRGIRNRFAGRARHSSTAARYRSSQHNYGMTRKSQAIVVEGWQRLAMTL